MAVWADAEDLLEQITSYRQTIHAMQVRLTALEQCKRALLTPIKKRSAPGVAETQEAPETAVAPERVGRKATRKTKHLETHQGFFGEYRL